MKNIMNTAWIAASLLAAPSAMAFTATGNVTPTGMMIKVTGASLIKTDSTELKILSGDNWVEFTRAGENFAAIPMAGISVPFGRYIGVRLEFDDKYQVKLNGTTYVGGAGGTLAGTGGELLYTTTAVADSSSSAFTETAGTATYVTLPSVSNCSDCSNTTWFAETACVASSAADCQSGDQYVGGNDVKLPDLNVIVDLYQSILIDAVAAGISRGAVYPFAMIGNPGAAIHLAMGGEGLGGSRNVSMIFGEDKRLQSVATWGAGITGGPTGGSWVSATAGPNKNAYGPTMLSEFTTDTNGTVKFPMGNCDSSSNCTSSGLAVLTGVLQAVGSTVSFTCTDDSTGALGHTYTGGDCTGFGAASLTITRVVDPNRIFEICAQGETSCHSGALPGTDADGYL